MKVLLSYGNYFNHGKQYQVKFIYKNEAESEAIKKLIKSYSKVVIPYEEKINQGKNNVIGGTNIPNNILLQFISELIINQNATVIIGNKEFTTFDLVSITEAIDSLHINVNLKKGDYFGLKDCYYVTFKYATDEQRTEVSYDFNVNLASILGQDYNVENNNYIYPFIIDRNGKITIENTGIIGGTNIPKQAIPFFITRFINGYDAIVTIGNEKLKKSTDNSNLSQALLSIEPGRSRKYKPNKNKKDVK